MMKKFFLIFMLFSTKLISIEINDTDFSISGFGNTSVTTSNNKNPLIINRDITDETCFNCDTTFGFQLDYTPDNWFRFSAQTVKPPQNSFTELDIEWLYIAARLSSKTELRAGRLRLPVFMASPYYYVGNSYLWTRPPTEVYDSLFGITSFDGVELLWNESLSDNLVLSVQPFLGYRDTSYENGLLETKIRANNVIGINLGLSSYSYKINLSYVYTNANLRQISSIDILNSPDSKIILNLFSLGFEYEYEKYKIQTEFNIDSEFFNWYTTLSYNMEKLTPYLTYAESHQLRKSNSITIGTRYDIIPELSINLEYEYFKNYGGDYIFFGQYSYPQSFLPEKSSVDASLFTVMLNFSF